MHLYFAPTSLPCHSASDSCILNRFTNPPHSLLFPSLPTTTLFPDKFQFPKGSLWATLPFWSGKRAGFNTNFILFTLWGHYKEHLQTYKRVQHVTNMLSSHVGPLGAVQSSSALDFGAPCSAGQWAGSISGQVAPHPQLHLFSALQKLQPLLLVFLTQSNP